MHWFMGPAEEIQGFWADVNHPYIEVEDSAVAAVRFKNGGLGSVLVSNSQKPGLYAQVHIHGDAAWSLGVQTGIIAGMNGVAGPPFNDLWTIPGEEELLNHYRTEDEAFFRTIDVAVYQTNRRVLPCHPGGPETPRFRRRRPGNSPFYRNAAQDWRASKSRSASSLTCFRTPP
jgi:hypothetical protein